MWMFVTMLPFLGFLSGVTSRYQYAPAMGFALMVAALLNALLAALERRTGRVAAAAIVGLCIVFTVARFAGFTGEAIRDRLAWFDAYRAYADAFRSEHPVLPADGQVTAPAPQHPNVMAEYIQPMLRWIYERGDLIVTVVPGPPRPRGSGS
jgi:predicted PurR-regulated permease PerM